MPVGSKKSGRPAIGSPAAAAAGQLDISPMVRIQAVFMIIGSAVGILGVILPHPASFQVPQLLTLNFLSIIMAVGVWVFAGRVTEPMARVMPALGSMAVTIAVIFSRDPTSAYALLYLFPGVYSYYFLHLRDALFHIVFAAANYAFAILYIGLLDSAAATASGSIVHHFVVTVGMLLLIGVMLGYLRKRVERLMGEIIESARTDLLTGLLNSRGSVEVLSGEVERARMGAHRVAVLNVSIGGLLEFRTKVGHQAADGMIKEIGMLLDDSTRRIDSVARIGANEFSVILPETDESTGFLLAEQVLARFRRAYRERELSLSTSIGVASFPKHASSAEGLTQASAAGAEAARALGSDRAVVYSAELEDVLSGDPARQLGERRTHLSTVLSLAEVLDLRDARTAAHSLAVSRYCELIGKELGLPDARVQRLRLAGMLHDIGKVGIPDSILDKPGPLSPDEWDEVRRHPEMAARILGAQELTDIREWILNRHEQPDGHGYPRGLSGDAIPIESRILAVAESYDAITSERPYRPARDQEEAIAELGRYVGSQFDGKVVDALLAALRSSSETASVGGDAPEA
ncbi:MAG TPA: HD domain-containing phosphohydrolase [Solirubrobacterales bacterium]|nr:HD domain-containing phosphohydrolase [Solirubrobacterales bacterium]